MNKEKKKLIFDQDRFDELEEIAKKRYIEKYSKKEFESDVEVNGIRDIVDEFLTKEELREYIKITYLEQGEEYIFYKLFGDMTNE